MLRPDQLVKCLEKVRRLVGGLLPREVRHGEHPIAQVFELPPLELGGTGGRALQVTQEVLRPIHFDANEHTAILAGDVEGVALLQTVLVHVRQIQRVERRCHLALQNRGRHLRAAEGALAFCSQRLRQP